MELIQIKSEKINLSLKMLDVGRELRRRYMQTSEPKKITIRCLRSIKRSAQYLAHQHNCHQIDIYRIVVRRGIPHLYDLPGVTDVKDVRIFLLKNAADLDDIRAQEMRFFDFKTNETVLFTGRFPESDISQCDSLAEILSLNRTVVCQMAMIHSLVRTDIPAHFHNLMADAFIRFRNDVKRWGERAVKTKNNCEKISASASKIGFEEIFGEGIYECE